MFVDHIKVYAKAGDGGRGSAHFRREKYEPKGGPDGGDGGKGGDVIIEVDHSVDGLRDFFFRSRLIGKDGQHGAERNRTGKSGQKHVVKVPPGTLVYEVPEGADPKTDDLGEPIADLLEPGQTFVLCRGGKGGRGNTHFKSSTNRAPDEAEEGEPGEEGEFYLELRQIADAGLVGFPNAGKSTLLNAISAAAPKVGAYPFTTLKPMVGVVEFPGFQRATVADIPGLIEGAHRNVGLGHEFLRHIMRCQLLLFVVDIAGSEGREPIEDLQILRKEISLHDDGLAKYPWVIIANKIDLEEAEEKLRIFRGRFPNIEIIPISALGGEGIDTLRSRLQELVAHRPE